MCQSVIIGLQKNKKSSSNYQLKTSSNYKLSFTKTAISDDGTGETFVLVYLTLILLVQSSTCMIEY